MSSARGAPLRRTFGAEALHGPASACWKALAIDCRGPLCYLLSRNGTGYPASELLTVVTYVG